MEKIVKMISQDNINLRILELAKKINKDYANEELLVVPILKGGAMFGCDLIKNLKMPVTLDFIITSSYKDKMVSSGNVEIIKWIDEDIKGKNVLLVDDIIDSGRTLLSLKEKIIIEQPKSLAICTLLDKPKRRELAIDSDYVGFTIENYFVVGYGLDYKNQYRNLPYIGKVENTESKRIRKH